MFVQQIALALWLHIETWVDITKSYPTCAAYHATYIMLSKKRKIENLIIDIRRWLPPYLTTYF